MKCAFGELPLQANTLLTASYAEVHVSIVKVGSLVEDGEVQMQYTGANSMKTQDMSDDTIYGLVAELQWGVNTEEEFVSN